MPTLQALCSHFSMAGGQATAWFFEGIVEGGIEAGGAKSSPRKLVELIEHKVLRGQPVVVMALLSTEAQVHDVIRRPNLHQHDGHDIHVERDHNRKRHWWLHQKNTGQKVREPARDHFVYGDKEPKTVRTNGQTRKGTHESKAVSAESNWFY